MGRWRACFFGSETLYDAYASGVRCVLRTLALIGQFPAKIPFYWMLGPPSTWMWGPRIYGALCHTLYTRGSTRSNTDSLLHGTNQVLYL